MSLLIFFDPSFEGLIEWIEIEFMFVDDSSLECTDRFEIPSVFLCVYERLCHMEMLADVIDDSIDHAFALLK